MNPHPPCFGVLPPGTQTLSTAESPEAGGRAVQARDQPWSLMYARVCKHCSVSQTENQRDGEARPCSRLTPGYQILWLGLAYPSPTASHGFLWSGYPSLGICYC